MTSRVEVLDFTAPYQTYGVIDLTVTNGTSEPFAPANYQVYMFKSPGVQDRSAPVPES